MNGHILRISQKRLREFNLLISAIESFMEKVWSLLKAYIGKLAGRVVTPCRVVAS